MGRGADTWGRDQDRGGDMGEWDGHRRTVRGRWDTGLNVDRDRAAETQIGTWDTGLGTGIGQDVVQGRDVVESNRDTGEQDRDGDMRRG